MRVLIIHHLESVWSEGYKRYGTSFWKEAEKVRQHLEEIDYDIVILTRFEEWELGDEHYEAGLEDHITAVHTYSYGWCKEMAENDPQGKYVEGGAHSEMVQIAEWMQGLSACNVNICGAFDGECIEDLEIALTALGVEYRRLEGLIV